MAEHSAHPSATALRLTGRRDHRESTDLDAGRRDQLGRSFATVESIRETLTDADKRRMDIALPHWRRATPRTRVLGVQRHTRDTRPGAEENPPPRAFLDMPES
jgi:hypothetical protein